MTLSSFGEKPNDLGPEKDISELETKLTTAENNYDIERRKFTPISNIWYSSAGLTITVAVFIASFLITTFLAPAFSSDLSAVSFSNKLQFSSPISLGALTVPLMIYAVANNVKLQKQNSTLSAIYSEISGLRSRITSLQQKIFIEGQKKGEKKPWLQAIRDELTFARSVLVKIVSEVGSEDADKYILRRLPEGFTVAALWASVNTLFQLWANTSREGELEPDLEDEFFNLVRQKVVFEYQKVIQNLSNLEGVSLKQIFSLIESIDKAVTLMGHFKQV